MLKTRIVSRVWVNVVTKAVWSICADIFLLYNVSCTSELRHVAQKQLSMWGPNTGWLLIRKVFAMFAMRTRWCERDANEMKLVHKCCYETSKFIWHHVWCGKYYLTSLELVWRMVAQTTWRHTIWRHWSYYDVWWLRPPDVTLSDVKVFVTFAGGEHHTSQDFIWKIFRYVDNHPGNNSGPGSP